jgi:hypothetical protein
MIFFSLHRMFSSHTVGYRLDSLCHLCLHELGTILSIPEYKLLVLLAWRAGVSLWLQETTAFNLMHIRFLVESHDLQRYHFH